jgi:hypothetical protein
MNDDKNQGHGGDDNSGHGGGGTPGPGGGGGDPGRGGGDHDVVAIVINGTHYDVPKGNISYEQLLIVINAPALPEDKRYSVQYSNGPEDKPLGTLIEGGSVKVKKGMEFDVTPANRS